MNGDHAVGAAVGGSGTVSAMAALTGTIAHYQGVDSATAADEAALVLIVIGAAVGVIAWFVQWKFPTAPAFPRLARTIDQERDQSHA